MISSPHLRVSHPPPKPLMIWDGDCHFCGRWIERWREITAGRVDYERFQTAAARFPEIPRDEFEKAVQFIEPDGQVFRAAEAVYRSLGHSRYHRFLTWLYDHGPGVAPISEGVYSFIANHRTFASKITGLLWGKDVRPPTYFRARRLFLRALGLVYLIAFISLWVQVDGLIGANGISPVSQFLPAAKEQIGDRAHFILPTLCWLNSSDAFLHFLCGAGVAVSIALILGLVPILCLVLLLAFYLSLTIAGQTFLSFQWDILLLETGFLAIFFAPLTWRMTARARSPIFACRFLFAPAVAFQTHVHVRCSEANEWRRLVVESDRTRLPLLDAAVTDRSRVVRCADVGVVEEIVHVDCARRRNTRSVSDLGAATIAFYRFCLVCGAAGDDRADGKLLFLQPAHDRALRLAFGRCADFPTKKRDDRRPPLQELGSCACSDCDAAAQCIFDFLCDQTGNGMAPGRYLRFTRALSRFVSSMVTDYFA